MELEAMERWKKKTNLREKKEIKQKNLEIRE